MTILWSEGDEDTIVKVLNDQAVDFAGVDFLAWYGRSEVVAEPPSGRILRSVFGIVISGDSTTYREVPRLRSAVPTADEVLQSPLRNSEFTLELHLEGEARSSTYSPIFNRAAYVLATECDIDPQTFEGPSSSDLSISKFAGFSAVAATFEAWFS